jgi:HTH-type transcriptional regulator/antitoxin HigA
MVLIQACIAAGMSQTELAERLDLKEPQIQRYEATDYGSASLPRVCEVARSLGLKVDQGGSRSGFLYDQSHDWR